MFIKIKKLFRKKQKRVIDKNEINQDELEKMVEKGAIILDVRSPQEYKEGHINGSISIPDYEINSNIEKVINNKQAVIITYCSSGQRSKKAQKQLTKMGYTRVYNLHNGFQDY